MTQIDGGLEQRRLNRVLDYCLTELGPGQAVTFDGDVLRDEFRPMNDMAVNIIRLAQVCAGLRDAEESFSLEGHLTMAARRHGCRWFKQDRPWGWDAVFEKPPPRGTPGWRFEGDTERSPDGRV